MYGRVVPILDDQGIRVRFKMNHLIRLAPGIAFAFAACATIHARVLPPKSMPVAVVLSAGLRTLEYKDQHGQGSMNVWVESRLTLENQSSKEVRGCIGTYYEIEVQGCPQQADTAVVGDHGPCRFHFTLEPGGTTLWRTDLFPLRECNPSDLRVRLQLRLYPHHEGTSFVPVETEWVRLASEMK